MRTNEIRLAGMFWMATRPEKKAAGTLTISDGGKIDLEIIGTFDRDIEDWNKNEQPDRIMGQVENKNYVTLEDCGYRVRRHWFGGGVGSAKIKATEAYLGVAYEHGELITFTSMYFSVEGLNEWHEISGFHLEHASEFREIALTFKAPPDLDLWSNGDFTLSLCFNWTVPSVGGQSTASITQGSAFRLKSTVPRPTNDFIKLANRLVLLVSFAIGKIASIREVVAHSPDFAYELSGGTKREVDIEVYFRSSHFSEKPPDCRHIDPILPFTRFQRDRQAMVDAWLTLCEGALPALRLFFEARSESSQYLNVRYMYMAQAVETLHRRTGTDASDPKISELVAVLLSHTPDEHRKLVEGKLKHWGEPSLYARLQKMLRAFQGQFGDGKARNDLVEKAVIARNYFTHYDEDIEKKMPTDAEVLQIFMRLEVLFEFWILKMIGLTESEIGCLAKSHRDVHRRLTWKPVETQAENPRDQKSSESGGEKDERQATA